MIRAETAPLLSQAEVLEWLRETTNASQMRVREVPLRELERWNFALQPLRLSHESGQFFSIVGVRHRASSRWDQPMIDQPEVGILGFLAKTMGGERCLLAQAKVEPGNAAGAQLAPTVQATRSNYTKVHGGRVPPYLDYFRDTRGSTVILDQLQSEQASRFLYKRNRNLLIEPADEVPLLPGFRWIPWPLLTRLLRLDNTVNMDARSVISCVPYNQVWNTAAPSPFQEALAGSARVASEEGVRRILSWFTRLRAEYPRRNIIIGLDEMEGWNVSERAIARPDGRFFSVIGVDVEIKHRETPGWSQPLLKHHGRGLNGMIAQWREGTLRFLMRGCCYPGSIDNFELGSTVSLSSYESKIASPGAPPFLEYFVNPDPRRIRYASLQCEEGGRFLHYENQYMLLQQEPETIREAPEGFVWMTLGEIYALLPHGYLSIEARNLLACLHGAG